MRLPIVPPLSTKDGASNKNARLTNCLKESKKTGDKAVIRPGLVLDAVASGVGNGLVSFNGELVSVYGTTLGLNTAAGTVPVTSEVLYSNDAQIAGIVYINDEFVIVGYDDNEGDNFWANGDGETFGLPNYIGNANNINWVAASPSKIVYVADEIFRTTTTEAGNYVFAAVVGVVTIASATLTKVRYLGGKFIAIAYNSTTSEVCWSDDGDTWSTSGALSGVLADVSYDGTKWMFWGGDTLFATAPVGYSTTNFSTFPSLSLSFPVGVTQIYQAAYIAGYYFVFASDGVNAPLYGSTDGLTFTLTTASNISSFTDVPQMAEVNGGYLYIKATPNPNVTGREIFRTSNGVDWEFYASVASSSPELIAFGPLFNVALSQYDTGYYPLTDTGVSDPTIPALATVTGTHFDFAQSPL